MAGINKKEKFIKIKNLLFDEFDKLKKLFKILGNHYGLIILSRIGFL